MALNSQPNPNLVLVVRAILLLAVIFGPLGATATNFDETELYSGGSTLVGLLAWKWLSGATHGKVPSPGGED